MADDERAQSAFAKGSGRIGMVTLSAGCDEVGAAAQPPQR